MDPLLAADRLPRFADLAMRRAVCAALAAGTRPALRTLVNDALVRFERAVQLKARDGVRPALLFAQRDRIVQGLRAFMGARIAARLFGLRRRDVISTGAKAGPFDAIVRGRDGKLHAVVLRAVPRDGRRLELYRRIRTAAAAGTASGPIASITVCDLDGGPVRTLKMTRANASLAA